MQDSYTAQTIYDVEALFHAEGAPLMKRAVQGLVEVITAHIPSQQEITVFAGRGHNGADGLYAACTLAKQGHHLQAVITFNEEDLNPGATQEALAAASEAGVEIIDSRDSDFLERALAAPVWVDGLTGLGVRPPLRGEIGAVVQRLVQARGDHRNRIVFAIDVPSGVDVDNGFIPSAVLQADHTVTFGGYKPAHLLPPAAHVCGQIHLIDIGIDQRLQNHRPAVSRVQPGEVGRWWPLPGVNDHKYTRGVVGLVTGSAAYPGAAFLNIQAALGVGVGMVRYLGSVTGIVPFHPEVVTQQGRVQAYVVGSGVSGKDSPDAWTVEETLAYAMAENVPVVVDAGALDWVEQGSLAGHVSGPHIILTPHAGELAQLLTRLGEDATRDDVEEHPFTWVTRAHELTGATVVLKGNITLIASTDGVFSQAEGTPWMATAGSGDVLAGIMGAMLATWVATPEPAWPSLGHVVAGAVALHGMAGSAASGGGPLVAGDVAKEISHVIRELMAH